MARTPWKIHLWAWDLAERCFSSLCEMVKKFELKKIWIKKKIELKKIWKKCFSVRTYVKPNLVFSKISLCKMYSNVLKIHFWNGQNSLENTSMSLRFGWEMLQIIMWNGEKIWTKKIWIKKKNWIKKNLKKKSFSVRTYVKPNLVFSKISFMLGGGGCPKIKVAQNGVETWSRFGIFEIRWNFRNLVLKVNKQPYIHPDTIVSR